MSTLILVRHGATAWNESGYCQGLKDVPLSAGGEEQIRLLRAAMAEVAVTKTFASPLVRAQQTARLLGHEPEIVPDLAEIDRGHWEGHPMDEVKRRWGKLYRAWYEDPAGLAMPGGEAFDDLWDRAGRVLDRVEAEAGGVVLACGHKAINRVLVARATGRPSRGVWDIPQPQAGRTVLHRAAGGTWTAEIVGDVSHLPAGLRSES